MVREFTKPIVPVRNNTAGSATTAARRRCAHRYDTDSSPHIR